MRGLLSVLCAALLAIAPAAEASITTTGAGKPAAAGGGGGGYTGPGDVVGGAKAFWGLRAYSSVQADGTHRAINVRNTSTAETCDILINTSGGLGNTTACSGSSNGQAVATFCVTSTGCAIVTFYGQIAGFDATQATAANQATLNLACLNGGTVPCATFNGTSNFYPSTITNTPQPLTVLAVAQRTGSPSTHGEVIGGASTGVFFRGSVANAVSGYFGAAFMTNATPVADGSPHALAWVINNGSSSSITADGALFPSVAPGVGSLGANAVIGAATSSTNFLGGFIAEVAVYPSALTTTAGTGQACLLSRNMATYAGIAVSC